MRKTLGYTLIELLCVVAIIAILAAIGVPNFLEAQVRSKVARMESDMAVLSSALRAYYADYNRYPPNQPLAAPFFRGCLAVDEVNGSTLPTPESSPISWTREDYYGVEFPGGAPVDPMGLYMDSTLMQERPTDRVTSPGLGAGEVYGMPTNPFHKRRRENPPFFEGSVSRYPVLDVSGWALTVLTTPVPYYSRQIPPDVFQDRHGCLPVYINFLDLYPENELPSDGGRVRRYLLLSYGPNKDASKPDFRNPVKGPFVPYDPTNGSVSAGDIFTFGN